MPVTDGFKPMNLGSSSTLAGKVLYTLCSKISKCVCHNHIQPSLIFFSSRAYQNNNAPLAFFTLMNQARYFRPPWSDEYNLICLKYLAWYIRVTKPAGHCYPGRLLKSKTSDSAECSCGKHSSLFCCMKYTIPGQRR